VDVPSGVKRGVTVYGVSTLFELLGLVFPGTTAPVRKVAA
jgi:hypothetical protein